MNAVDEQEEISSSARNMINTLWKSSKAFIIEIANNFHEYVSQESNEEICAVLKGLTQESSFQLLSIATRSSTMTTISGRMFSLRKQIYFPYTVQ